MAKKKPFYFNWQDEAGTKCGWNTVWAQDKIKAIKAARQKERQAKEFVYQVRIGAKVEDRVGRAAGLYVNIGSVRQITLDELMELERLANMMCS
jgi:hypothetical protein